MRVLTLPSPRAVPAMLVAVALVIGACTAQQATPPPGTSPPATGGSAFAEPVRLSAEGGVLEVRLRAHQGAIALDTVATPVRDALTFGYEVVRGTSSAERSAESTYPAPTLHVEPGDRLVVHLVNDLRGLTVPDLLDPAFTPVGQAVPEYPKPLTSMPLNLHTHGLHVSPKGNSDNVLLDIPPGQTNTYTYDLPSDHPQGLYWYHSHRHTLTAAQTYMGLAGLLEVGRPDGDLPAVTEHQLPVRTMAIQYNGVFDRKGGGAKLNNVNWPQYVSTLTEPTGNELADGTYTPALTPVNFGASSAGTTAFTNWWTGPLSVNNNRGQFQFIPSNLQSFTSRDDAPTSGTDPVAPTLAPGSTTTPAPPVDIPVDPSLPDHQRDVQFTVNGRFQPTITAPPRQTEIWVLANISDFAYTNVTLTETATGTHPRIAIVGQDGNPYEAVHAPTTGDGTTLLIPPGSRYAIAVTMPETGELLLEMPAAPGGQTMSNEGVLYTSNGTDQPPAVLGTVSVPASSVSYVDGFFTTPTQVLLRARTEGGAGTTEPFAEGQPLGAKTSFDQTEGQPAAVERKLVVSGGFTNNFASTEDPKAFVYEFDGNAFPYIPLLQPRLGTIEQWTIVNQNNDEHPIHIHVNDFQVAQTVDPVAGTTTGYQPWGQDNANLPAPSMDAAGNVITEGLLALRTKFKDFTGTFVIHCHRLNHEDNGLMAIVNVLPAVSSYAVARTGAPGRASTVELHDGADDRVLATVTPDPGYEGDLSVAMGDVDGDQVLDLVAGTASGRAEVTAWSGAPGEGGQSFTRQLARFTAFDGDRPGGVRVAASNVAGGALADNIVVAGGPGAPSEVKVFGTGLPSLGTAPSVFATFDPYPGSRAGVEVATGMVDVTSGRPSIVTAPGPGEPAKVKVFRFDLYTPNGASAAPAPTPTLTSTFDAFDAGYTDGVSLTTGWVAGALGGAQHIVLGQRGSAGLVGVYSSGSALDGQPQMYTQSPEHHGSHISFQEVASFAPFAAGGVRVAATSTTYGADLLVSGAANGTGRVDKLRLVRNPNGTPTLVPEPVTSQPAGSTGPAALGGA